MSKSLLLFTLLTLAEGQSTVPCSITGTILAEASIADAPSGVVDQSVYIFPHICDEGHGVESPCHYYCDTTNDQGWKQDKSANHSINWVGAASAVGELSDGTEALFMMGGGPTNAPLDHFVYYSKKEGVVTLPPLRYGALALSTAAYLKPNIYLLGGVNRKFYNTQVYRYDTTTLTWLTDNLKAAGSFTPRVGLSSTILNGVIVTAGGHTGTGGTSKYSGAFEMLEIDRAAGKDTELKWHQGPDMQFPRAYAAIFNAGCRIYVAGGAMDGGAGSKYAKDLKYVEVYSTVDSGDDMSSGYWSRTKDIKEEVSHVNAVVLPNGEHPTTGYVGMLIGGVNKGEPQNYLQVVEQACTDSEHPTQAHQSYDGLEVPGCDTTKCSYGYLTQPKTSRYDPTVCSPCPGVSNKGLCSAPCGGGFGDSGTCKFNTTITNTLLSILSAGTGTATPPLPICKCAEYYSGMDCNDCIDNRAGQGCKACEEGRHGPDCAACPGLNSFHGVCGSHGECRGAGSTSKLSDGGICDCDSGWDNENNCTTCSNNYYGAECRVCTCEATIHNSTNAAECKFSNICNGHGNCSMVEGQQCDCDVGWEGDECDETEGGGGLGGGIIFLIVCLSGGAVIGGFFLIKRVIDDDDEEEEKSATTSNAIAGGAYPTATNSNVQGSSSNYGTSGGGGTGTGAGSATTNNIKQPLLGASSDTDDLMARMMAASNSNVKAATPVVGCPSCGRTDGITDGSNFCGLCGTKVR